MTLTRDEITAAQERSFTAVRLTREQLGELASHHVPSDPRAILCNVCGEYPPCRTTAALTMAAELLTLRERIEARAMELEAAHCTPGIIDTREILRALLLGETEINDG